MFLRSALSQEWGPGLIYLDMLLEWLVSHLVQNLKSLFGNNMKCLPLEITFMRQWSNLKVPDRYWS